MDNRVIRDITIIGGGTAGWLTALYVKTVMPTKIVTVVESKEIGILGAGEGSTPPLISLLDVLEIPFSKLVKDTGATVKNAIKFTNWNGEGEKDFYYNSFTPFGNLSPYALGIERFAAGNPPLWGLAVAAEDSQIEYDYMAAISEQSKVPFRIKKDEQYSAANPIFQFEQMSGFSMHFDARKLADTLKEIAMERGIIHIEGEVNDFTEDEHGDVDLLKLAHGAEIKTDFIFDCTGFKSFFTDKFKTKWISYKEYLTVDSAVPFFLDMERPIPPYTEAVAMNYGWIWKIPLQDRYGCGYVYDSNYVSEEEARAEIVEWLGYEPEWPRKTAFKFEAGCYAEPWKKNVISTGLSAGFIEPLEATSIWSSMISIARVLGNTESLYRRDDRIRQDYNKYVSTIHERIAGFIYLHYMGGRTDTEFWKHFTKENAPEYLKSMLDIVETRNFVFEDIAPEDQFPLDTWHNVMIGLKNPDMINNLKEFEFYNFSRSHLKNNYHFYKKTIEQVAEFESVSHDEFLEKLSEEK
jgi:tryptophan halogenase